MSLRYDVTVVMNRYAAATLAIIAIAVQSYDLISKYGCAK